MIATSLLSLVLLALAGFLLDAHRREWRCVVHRDETDPAQNEAADRFARCRFRRRRFASALIAVLGVLIGVWPVVPREPWPMLYYVVALSGLPLALIGFAASDAWASGKHYRGESRRRLAQHTEQLREAIDRRRLASEAATEAEANHA